MMEWAAERRPFFAGGVLLNFEDMDKSQEQRSMDEDGAARNKRAVASTKLTAKSKRKMAFWTFMFLVCLLAGGAGGLLLYMGNALQPTEPGQEVKFTIPRGISSARIANQLEQNGLIRNGTVFAYYLKYKKMGDQFQAGEYAMSPGIELERIIEMLNNGETIQPETFKATIAEGLTVEQIAELLADQGIVDKAKWLDLAANPEKLQPSGGMTLPAFIKQIPNQEGMKFALEGYLFPETYEMLVESTEQDIMFRLIQELVAKLKGLPEDWDEQMNKLGLTFHEMLTIASLIEREVALDDERPIVASVIYNRIKKKMRLEIDATVQYALAEHKDRLLIVDTKIESPYNTYLHAGLPPGPIASPSLASIHAALYPEESKYLFYVTKKDGTKGHLFAETLKQHQNNINASNKTAKNN